jgi:hypothetical protein
MIKNFKYFVFNLYVIMCASVHMDIGVIEILFRHVVNDLLEN